MICHQCNLRQSLTANWFKSWCFFVVVPVHYVSRNQDGFLRLFWIWTLIRLKRVDSLPMWLFMTCDVNDGVSLFSLWLHLACAYLLNQRMNTIWQVLLSLEIFAEPLGSKSGTLCSSLQFYFSNMPIPTSAISVAIWIPSSVSTPQVGFMCITTSLIREARLKFQIPGRRRMEVPCSGVPVGSGNILRCVRSTLGSENRKELKRFPSFCHRCLRQSLTANWFKYWWWVNQGILCYKIVWCSDWKKLSILVDISGRFRIMCWEPVRDQQQVQIRSCG